MDISKIYVKWLLKNVKCGISRSLGSREIQKQKWLMFCGTPCRGPLGIQLSIEDIRYTAVYSGCYWSLCHKVKILFNICTYICTIFSLLISKREIVAGFPIMKRIEIFSKGKGKFQIKGEGQYKIPQKVKCRCNFPKQRRNDMRNLNRRRCKYWSSILLTVVLQEGALQYAGDWGTFLTVLLHDGAVPCIL